MKLKTGYFFGAKGAFLGYDSDGRPIYGSPKPEIPFKFTWEPFSPLLATNTYGLSTIEVRYRLFVRKRNVIPSTYDKFKTNTEFVYNGYKYKITYTLKYDNHLEVLITEVGAYT
ncbi:hypothetical protein ACTXGU_00200 [Niallia sp. 01092]|uniref:hypothetical protein n=1 Tax=Niallia sp. 01092 TaxID=3457759 RepID=UPI003FD62134